MIFSKSVNVLFMFLFAVFCNTFVYAQSKDKDPYISDYVQYQPDFIKKLKDDRDLFKAYFSYTEKEMELSSELNFYTLNEVEEVNRANALVKVAIENEMNGDYRKAMALYQDVITRFSVNANSEVLYRVSPFGVFVPVAQYCQRRLLNFPKEHLDFFRTLRDPEAKELFEEASKKYSLILFSEIVDKYLATSYGGKALLFLGDAAFDRGNYLEALEQYQTIVDFIPDKALQTPELNLKIQFCKKVLGQKNSAAAEVQGKSLVNTKDLATLKELIAKEETVVHKVVEQKNSSDYISGDDYTRFKPTMDALGIRTPEWESELLGSRNDNFVYAQPVVTDTSIIVRLKNIIYCYSILNGTLRWKNDIGGRANWQNWFARQYPLEDIVVQDGVIVTPMLKGGASLVALDEITGQIRWSYGPMSASEGDESLMRFECAPAGGPGTVYANYILDNIKGDTHIDSEYGVIAFESTTGRVKWRRQVCRLLPGKFEASFGGFVRRNRIRSFSSPPLYHEGTVYTTTNAGAIAAMDGLSGRIKWLTRYPYYKSIHDATRQFGQLSQIHGGMSYVHPHSPMFWLNQRPLIIGESLYVVSVDNPYLFNIDRDTGKINWSFKKPTGGFSYFLGAISTGELVVTGNGRGKGDANAPNAANPLYLVNPKDGSIAWKAPDYILPDTQPVMTTYFYQTPAWFSINNRYFENAARPFLMDNDKIIMTSWTDYSIHWRRGMYIYGLGEIDLKSKKVLAQRRYYSGPVLAHADWIINDEEAAKQSLKILENLPVRAKADEEKIVAYKKILADTVPVNEYPEFRPFSRVTFLRYGVLFELRLSPREIAMVYDRKKLEENFANDNSLLAIFGKSEICVKDGNYHKAAEYLNQCLALVSPEDVNFRALIKQQFYKVYLALARAAIRSNKPQELLKNALGMSNTSNVISEEIETLLILSEAYVKTNQYQKAVDCLRVLIDVYGHHEYPISSLTASVFFNQEEAKEIQSTFNSVISEAKQNTGSLYNKATVKTLDLIQSSFPLYYSSVSPLPKELIVRTGDFAILKLLDLLKNTDYGKEYGKQGDIDLAGDHIEQLLYHIWKYPNVAKGQETFDRIFSLSEKMDEDHKHAVWLKLIHIAKVCKFKMPSTLSTFANPNDAKVYPPISGAAEAEYTISGFKDPIMVIMERQGDLASYPNLLFLSVKIPKKIGFRFSVICFDVSSGKEVWKKEEFRLKDLGQEPGFYNAYVYKDVVIVNGIYDVFCFKIKDGADVWHYKTPYGFEIEESTMSGNIFVLSGANETIALQIETKSPVGEVAWQQKEEGNIYYKPFFVNDALISVRKYPFNITSRFRSTGSILGRLAVSDLSLVDEHPILGKEDLSLPIAQYKQYLAVFDGQYIIIYDLLQMKMLWKTLLSNVDFSKEVKMRIALNDKYVVLIKEDFDRKAIYGYSLESGDLLWYTDPKNSGSPQPIYSFLLEGNMLYGVEKHAGQAFYFTSYDCSSGARKTRKLIEGFGSPPLVRLHPAIFGDHLVFEVQDRKDYFIIVVNKNTGEIVKKVTDKGDGSIGEVGRVSITLQNGHTVLFSRDHFKY